MPQSLIEICSKMMSKRPAARYQTADELSQVLAAWRPGEKRVQRVLQLKKAESVDELPGPDLLGTDLSELFRKGMGVSATTPLIARKPPPSRLDKLPAAIRPLLNTPLRAVLTLGVSAALVVLLIVASVLYFGKGSATVAQAPSAGSEANDREGGKNGAEAPPNGDKQPTAIDTGNDQNGGNVKPPDNTIPPPPPPDQDKSGEKDAAPQPRLIIHPPLRNRYNNRSRPRPCQSCPGRTL